MNELYHFSKYLEKELQKLFSYSSSSLTDNKTLDVDRINELQITMKILGEYEHHMVNQREQS